MIGQLAFDAGDLDIKDAMIVQHFLRHLSSGHAEGFLRVALELPLERSRDQPARQGDADE